MRIFLDPVTGRFKDGWRAVGEELRSLLTPEEYGGARRTTFTQFFTSPLVMRSMRDALSRFGVPDDALILKPGCESGNFLAHGKPAQRFIGVELDSLWRWLASAII